MEAVKLLLAATGFLVVFVIDGLCAGLFAAVAYGITDS